ncbi:MAG: hypothetical protein IJY00_02760 [Bacteroidaceae bacterium]|nr:hypothetical protein [Bacteroidaceae bacterium]
MTEIGERQRKDHADNETHAGGDGYGCPAVFFQGGIMPFYQFDGIEMLLQFVQEQTVGRKFRLKVFEEFS